MQPELFIILLIQVYQVITNIFLIQGDHNKVMELLQSIPNMEQKTTLNKDSNEREYIRVLREYSRSGDIENLEKTFQFLEEIL